jgi:hypothetical protein
MNRICEYNYNLLFNEYRAGHLEVLNELTPKSEEKLCKLGKSLMMITYCGKILQFQGHFFSSFFPSWPRQCFLNYTKDIISNFSRKVIENLSATLNRLDILQLYESDKELTILPYSNFCALHFNRPQPFNFLSGGYLDITIQHIIPLLDEDSIANLFESQLDLLPLWEKKGAQAYLDLINGKRIPQRTSLLLLALKICGKEITSLEIRDYTFKDEDLERVCRFCPRLSSLQLNGCVKLTDEGLKYLEQLSNLNFLNIGYCGLLTDKTLKSLTHFKNLKSLNIDGCHQMTKMGLKVLAQHVNITTFSSSYCNIQLVKKIKKFSHLSSLDMSRTHINDYVLNLVLKKLPLLNSLNIGFCLSLTDEGIKSVDFLKNLSSLKITWCQEITDQSMKSVAKVANLIFFDISYCIKITNRGLSFLGHLKNLEKIVIQECKLITDEGLKLLPNKTTILNKPLG